MTIQIIDDFKDISTFINIREMETICAPLLKIGVQCFGYLEFTKNGRFRWLINNEAFLELWAEESDRYFNHSVFCSPVTNHSGLYFLDTIYHLKPPCLSKDFFVYCPIKTGVAMVEYHTNLKKVYVFSTNDTLKFHANSYRLNELLKRFIVFFKNEASDLLRNSNYYQIPQLCLQTAKLIEHPELLKSSHINDFLTLIPDSKQPLEKIINHYQLTRREAECLSCLLNGASAKRVAEKMSISVRTAEHHIQSIREKTQSPNIKDLLVKLAGKQGELKWQK